MASNTSTIIDLSSCLLNKSAYDLCCLMPSLAIITILAFLRKRVRIRPDLREGSPGLVMPINFVSGSSHYRLSIAVAFVAIAYSCFQLFGFIPSSINRLDLGHSPWAKAFRSVVLVLLYGIINFPIFACLMTKHVLIGAVFGFLYTLMRFMAIMVLLCSCPSSSPELESLVKSNPAYHYTKLLLNLPSVVCYLFLLGRFSRMLYALARKYWRKLGYNRQKEMRKNPKRRKPDEDSDLFLSDDDDNDFVLSQLVTSSQQDLPSTFKEDVKNAVLEAFSMFRLGPQERPIYQAMVDNFTCLICHEIIKTDVIVGSCCGTIIGCRECLDTWYQSNETCPKCRNIEGEEKRVHLRGFSEALKNAKALSDAE